MGSLTSRPSVPSSVRTPTQVVTVAEPAPIVENNEPSAEETAAESRRQSLLGRERSRFGTISTGFRGLLGTIDTSAGRKTLLGE